MTDLERQHQRQEDKAIELLEADLQRLRMDLDTAMTRLHALVLHRQQRRGPERVGNA